MLNTISRVVLAVVFLAAMAFAQFGSHDVLYVASAPGGSCTAGSRVQVLTTGAGSTYTCQNITAGVGTWGVLSAGGASGTVTGVTAGSGLDVGGTPGATISLSGTMNIHAAAVTNAMLQNSAITIAGTSVTLGGSTSSLPSPGAIGGGTPAPGTFSSLTDTAMTGGPFCVHETSGVLSATAADCGTGGGGSVIGTANQITVTGTNPSTLALDPAGVFLPSASLTANGGLDVSAQTLGMRTDCANGQLLKWNFGASTWDCATITVSGGANTALSNLATPAVNVSLNPGVDATIDLNSPSLRYNNAWLAGLLGWTNGSGTPNAGLSSTGAGIVNCGNGTQGDASCTFQFGKAVGTGSSASLVGLGQGTAPSLAGFNNYAFWTAPTTIPTTYAMMVPSAAASGIFKLSSTVNQTGCTASATLLCVSIAAVNLASSDVTGVLASGNGGMLYPGSGIPNSTGSVWGTSYTTSGTGTVVALTNGPILSNPSLGSAGTTPSAITQQYLNTGTFALGTVVKLNGTSDTVTSVSTSDTEAVGIVFSSAGSFSQVAIAGTAACTFDNTSVAGHYVQISTVSSGDCRDVGTVLPTSGSVILGRVADGGTAGNHNVAIALTPTGGGVGSAHAVSVPLVCPAASANSTTYTCATSPSFTPAAGDVIAFKADILNTGVSTLAVNGASAATIKKLQGTSNAFANDICAGGYMLMEFDGTFWQMQGQQCSAVGGSGTVNSGTINHFGFYASSTNALSDAGTNITEATNGILVTGQGTTGTAFQASSAATGQVAATSNAFTGSTADIHDFDVNGVVKSSVDSTGNLHVVTSGNYESTVASGNTDFNCGIDGSTVSNCRGTFRGADHTGTGGTAEQAGNGVFRGGNSNSTANSATVMGGNATLVGGFLSNASPGALAIEGNAAVDIAYKGAGTIGTLGCPSATTQTIVSCATVAANQTWIGVIQQTTGASQGVLIAGDMTMTFDATITPTAGDIVCVSTITAGDVFDSVAVPCPNAQSYVGRVKSQLTAATTSAVVSVDHNPQVLNAIQNKVVNPTQAAAITTSTLCTAAQCSTAGAAYEVHWNLWGLGTACSSVTAGSVTFLLTWTDENAVTHSAVALQMQSQTGAATTAIGGTFPFQTALANESASGSFKFSTNGTIVQYATGYTACTTGTGTYGLRAEVVRLQ